MRLLILGERSSSHVQQLREAAEPDHEVVIAPLEQLSGQVAHGTNTVALGEGGAVPCDAAIVRAMPHGGLEKVITSMNLLGQLATQGVVVLNSPRSLEVAIDKYLATVKLSDAGLRVPQTIVCQSADAALLAFEAFGGDVVLKPLFGGEGRGVIRVQDREILERASRTLVRLDAMLLVQAHVPHPGWDYRLLVLGEQVWGIRRHVTGDWRTNLAQGARAEPVELTEELVDIGVRATRAVGCDLGGVDVMPCQQGQLHVLEVNAVPGWSGLAETLAISFAPLVIRHLEKALQVRPKC